MLLNWTKNLLKKHGIKPNKRMGQNFLISENARAKLVSSAEVKKTDVVLEVGAGIGTITVELAKLARCVIAVEKDKALIPILEETTKDPKNVKVVLGDVLKIEELKIDWKLSPCGRSPIGGKIARPAKPEGRSGGNWKLAGNIPYYLTAPLIRKFLESTNPPSSMTLMVQKEMAQRITAKPPDMSILAVSVQAYAKPEIVGHIPRSAFWPKPKVDSAIIKILPNPPLTTCQLAHDREQKVEQFFTIVRAGFSSPRKQLINNLSKGLNMDRGQAEQWLQSCRVDPKRRAETLRVEEWAYLTKLSP